MLRRYFEASGQNVLSFRELDADAPENLRLFFWVSLLLLWYAERISS